MLTTTRAGLLVAILATACPGEGPELGDSGPLEGGAIEQSGGNCSATGVAASCDPLLATGCGKGSCYVTANAGASCVCPEGSAKAGESCSSTPECAPGNVCAGKSAPGTCRKTCDPKVPACDSAMKCTFITDYPNFGYCEPK